MKYWKYFSIMLVLIVISTLPITYAAPASVDITPVADDIAAYNDSALNIETPLNAGGSADPSGFCISQYETFLKFDLSSSGVPIGSTLTDATLTLRSTGSLNGSTSITLRLFGSFSDDWSEGSGQIPWANRPPKDSDLFSTTTGPVAAGEDVVFGSTPELVNFLNAQLNTDGVATLVIQATACNFPAARQYMASKETIGANGVPARLTVTGTGPNAVPLSTFTTDTADPTWPLYAGLGALALIAAAGVAWSRRRAAVR